MKVMLMAIAITVAGAEVDIVKASDSAKGPAFALATAKSKMMWKGNKPGGGHYGIVEDVRGTIDTEGNTITGGSFVIDMNSIVVQDIKNEGMNKKLTDHLESEDFFYIEKYPEAKFNITSVKAKTSMKDGFSASHMVTGDLTIRGKTKEITFPAKVDIKNNMVSAKTGEFKLDRTEWNVNHMSKSVFADIKDRYIDDEMIISLDLVFEIN